MKILLVENFFGEGVDKSGLRWYPMQADSLRTPWKLNIVFASAGLILDQIELLYLLESLILAQDERWRRA